MLLTLSKSQPRFKSNYINSARELNEIDQHQCSSTMNISFKIRAEILFEGFI